MKILFVLINLFVCTITIAQTNADSLYQQSQVCFDKEQYQQGLSLLRQAAQANHVSAQYLMGKIYLDGRGAEANPILAAEWFSKAAAQEHYFAILELAKMYEKGIGVEKDLERAKQLYDQLRNSEDAQPTGGIQALYKYLRRNIRYPKEARKQKIHGKVFVSFFVEKDGSITNVQVTEGLGAGCDEEAIRLMENSPKWIPAKWKGKTVRNHFKTKLGRKIHSSL